MFKFYLKISLQFQSLEGDMSETDVSGTCDVLYENLSPEIVRKIKVIYIFEHFHK